jgi:hypothetical protein
MVNIPSELIAGDDIAKNANISLLYGSYVSDKGHNFTLEACNIVDVDQDKGHLLGCGCCDSTTESLQGVRVFSDDIRFRLLGLSDTHLYTFVLHPNGVVRYRINEYLPYIVKLVLGFYDSDGHIDYIKNLNHMNMYGCFCFGLLKTNGDMVRYNRWAEDCVYFTTFAKQT